MIRRDAVIVAASFVLMLAALIGASWFAVYGVPSDEPVEPVSSATVVDHPRARAVPATTVTTAAAPSTTATVVLIPPATAPARVAGTFRSTAYCLTGRMASGVRTYVGAVAGNRWALGTTMRVWPNPWGDPDMEFTVEDRHQAGATDLDFAMPGECDRALAWGDTHRVVVTITGSQL